MFLYIVHLLENLEKLQVRRFFFEKLLTTLQPSVDAVASQQSMRIFSTPNCKILRVDTTEHMKPRLITKNC
jgi:hypothetical protein